MPQRHLEQPDIDFIQIHREAIEKFFNSKEAEELLGDNDFSSAWDDLLQPRLTSLLEQPIPSPVEDQLYKDLRDWWKNGNFYHWEEDEVNAFGMMKWSMDDIDFWGDLPLR